MEVRSIPSTFSTNDVSHDACYGHGTSLSRQSAWFSQLYSQTMKIAHNALLGSTLQAATRGKCSLMSSAPTRCKQCLFATFSSSLISNVCSDTALVSKVVGTFRRTSTLAAAASTGPSRVHPAALAGGRASPAALPSGYTLGRAPLPKGGSCAVLKYQQMVSNWRYEVVSRHSSCTRGLGPHSTSVFTAHSHGTLLFRVNYSGSLKHSRRGT